MSQRQRQRKRQIESESELPNANQPPSNRIPTRSSRNDFVLGEIKTTAMF